MDSFSGANGDVNFMNVYIYIYIYVVCVYRFHLTYKYSF